jgi:Fusaric acid resistance protein-like
VTAATAYTLFHKTPAILAVFGFLFSMPCFYYIVAKPQYATTGRFVLLTYNLTCLFSYAQFIHYLLVIADGNANANANARYNSRQLDKSVVDIAIHRSTAVTVGVVWAGFVSRFWWPSEARRELGKQLGE